MKIGNYIKEQRLQKGMTQEELALKSNITVRTIQRIESGEVDPRYYTLQAIASVLEVDYNELVKIDMNVNESSTIEKLSSNESFWLAILHFSGFFLLIIPSVIIWTLKKDKIPNIRSHAIDVINFQLSMYVYLIIAAFLCFALIGIPIIILLGIYCLSIIIINTAKAANIQPYRYLFSINFIKK